MAEQEHAACATKRDVDEWFVQKNNVTRLRRCARGLGAEAEDTIQATYTKAVEGIHRLREKNRLEAWIHGIHRNILLSHWRRVRRTGVLPIDHAWSEDPSEEVVVAEILRFSETLPLLQRHVLAGIILEESALETAQRLGLTTHQVYYARDRMREALSPRLSLLWVGVPVRYWFSSVVGKLGLGKLVLGVVAISGLSLVVTAAVTDFDAGPSVPEPGPVATKPISPRPTHDPEPEPSPELEPSPEPEPNPTAETEPRPVVNSKPDRPSKETSLKLVGDIRELLKAGEPREALEKSKRLTDPAFRKVRAELQISCHCALGQREAARKLAETQSLTNPCD
jgi:DNA-directed RNA polymerase specialized sigma24 family protein